MSVRARTFVIRGAVLPYSAIPEDRDTFYDLVESHESTLKLGSAHSHLDGREVVLVDGMSGRYVAAGCGLAVSSEQGHFDEPLVVPTYDGHLLGQWDLRAAKLIRSLGLATPPHMVLGWHVITYRT